MYSLADLQWFFRFLPKISILGACAVVLFLWQGSMNHDNFLLVLYESLHKGMQNGLHYAQDFLPLAPFLKK